MTLNPADTTSRRITLLENVLWLAMLISILWLFTTQLNSNFTLPKLFAITICIGLLLPLHWLHHRHSGLHRLPVSLWLPALGLLIWWLFATTQAMHPRTAIEGVTGRFNGLYTHLLWLLLFTLLAQLPLTAARGRFLIHSLYVAIIPVCVYAWIQYLGFDPIMSIPTLQCEQTIRPPSAIGNPVSLGAVVLLVTPLAMVDVLMTERREQQLIYLFILGLLLITQLLTGSRGTWLGTVAVVVMVFVILYLYSDSRRKIPLRPVFIGLIIVSIVSALLIDWSSMAQRLQFGKGVEMRLMYFSAAWEMIKDHPLTGIGFESFRLLYPAYRPIKDATLQADTIPTMVHNDYLQLAIDNGLAALLLYIVLLVGIVTLMIKVIRNNPDVRHLLIGLLGGISGYLVQALSGWNEMAATTFFWLFLGLGTAIALSHSGHPVTVRNSWQKQAVIYLGLILCIHYGHFLLNSISKDYHLRQASYWEKGRRLDKALNEIKTLESMAVGDFYYQDQIGLFYLRQLIRRPSLLLYRKTYEHFHKAKMLNHYNPYVRLHILHTDTIALQRHLITDISAETRADIFEISNMDPNNPTIYKVRAALYEILGKVVLRDQDLQQYNRLSIKKASKSGC